MSFWKTPCASIEAERGALAFHVRTRTSGIGANRLNACKSSVATPPFSRSGLGTNSAFEIHGHVNLSYIACLNSSNLDAVDSAVYAIPNQLLCIGNVNVTQNRTVLPRISFKKGSC
jgi:hypothetical protein